MGVRVVRNLAELLAFPDDKPPRPMAFTAGSGDPTAGGRTFTDKLAGSQGSCPTFGSPNPIRPGKIDFGDSP